MPKSKAELDRLKLQAAMHATIVNHTKVVADVAAAGTVNGTIAAAAGEPAGDIDYSKYKR